MLHFVQTFISIIIIDLCGYLKNADLFHRFVGCPTNLYDYHGFRIRIAFLACNGPALQIIFEKRPGPFLKEDEVVAILNANTPYGMTWKPIQPEIVRNSTGPFGKLGATFIAAGTSTKAWKRSDGALADLQINRMNLTLSLPAAATLEQRAKEETEANRKAAIPAF
jgi:hypothetical protein